MLKKLETTRIASDYGLANRDEGILIRVFLSVGSFVFGDSISRSDETTETI